MPCFPLRRLVVMAVLVALLGVVPRLFAKATDRAAVPAAAPGAGSARGAGVVTMPNAYLGVARVAMEVGRE